MDNGSYKKLLWVGGDAALVKEKREEKLSVANLYKTRPLAQWFVGNKLSQFHSLLPKTKQLQIVIIDEGIFS